MTIYPVLPCTEEGIPSSCGKGRISIEGFPWPSTGVRLLPNAASSPEERKRALSCTLGSKLSRERSEMSSFFWRLSIKEGETDRQDLKT